MTVFPTSIYCGNISGASKILPKIQDTLEQLWEQPDAKIDWFASTPMCSTFPTTDSMDLKGKLIHELPEMADIVKQIKIIMAEYWEATEPNSKFVPQLLWMAANRYPDGIVLKHNHDWLFSACLYLYVDGKQNITFDSPLLKLHTKSEFIDYSNIESKHISFTLADNMIIFWPGWMDHTITTENPDNESSNIVRVCCPMQFGVVPK